MPISKADSLILFEDETEFKEFADSLHENRDSGDRFMEHLQERNF